MGLTTESAEKVLDELFEKRTRLQKQYDELSEKRNKETSGTGIRVESLEMAGVRQMEEKIEQTIATLREWWGIHLLEGLQDESRTIKWLTIILIALTGILAVFTGFLVSGVRLP